MVPRPRILAVLATLALALAVLVAAPGAARAQVNTSGVRGAVKASDGTRLPFATVTLVHVPSKNKKTTLTNEAGEFAFTGLRVGGPYSITAEADGFLPSGTSGLILSAGKNARVNLTLKMAEEVIMIEGSVTPTTTSQRRVFDATDIDNLPSVGRDPKDIVQLTPEAYLDGANKSMSIGGANNRYNSVTIDGIRQDDDFGLNGNGYPTQRSPISLMAIEEISVERSPFDVRYGKFLGGNVNVVTKSGGNEFHGALLGAFSNNALRGLRSRNIELDDVEFRELRYGLSLGGPIVKDKVHFFISVEGLDATTPRSVGPAGSGAAITIDEVSEADIQRAQQIAQNIYGFDAGVPSQDLDELDLKLLTKVDWAISDRQRLSVKYQRTGGSSISASGAFGDTLPLTSNWFERKDSLDAFAISLLSDWTPNFSSQLEFSGKLVNARSEPLSGNDFPEVEIETADGGTIVIGPDPFRHANQLDNDLFHAKFEGNYLLGRQLITGGLEYDLLQINNLFVPFSNGTATYDSLDAFEMQTPADLFYSNAVSNVEQDGAANWGYGVVAAFAQDQYEISPDLTAQGGVRFEVYHADDNIPLNENFALRHGFENTATINGRSVILPRAGVTYRPLPRLNLRGGVGLYSGGTPSVWVSNNYSNDGLRIDNAFSNDPAVINGFDGRTIPQTLQDELAEGDGNVDALDPDFKIPSTWKLAAGLDYSLDIDALGSAGKGLGLELNYVFSRVRHGMQWQDLRRNLDDIPANTPVGTFPDGRPYYDNDDTDGLSFDSRRGVDMLLTNTTKGHGHTLSVSMNKGFPFGLRVFGAYAFQSVKELSPANSSRSVSNYGLAAVGVDPNDPDVGTSNYERAHRFIGALSFSRALVEDVVGPGGLWAGKNTILSLFFESRSGQPYSYTFADGGDSDAMARLFGEEREFARRERQLFYVPRGDNSDVILNGIDPDELNQFLEDSGLDKYRGQLAPRNAFRSQWINRIDMRFAQDLPTGFPGQRARFIFDVQNLGNLLSSDWGQNKQVPFPYLVPVAEVDVDPATGRYVYSELDTDDPERVSVLASVWRLQASLMVEF